MKTQGADGQCTGSHCDMALPIQAKPGNDKYKTEMCRKIIDLGFCKYGNKCQFAHTIDELRYASKHRKFKSKACNNWHKNTPGSCRYGNRCCYIHDEDDATLLILREAYGGGRGPPDGHAHSIARHGHFQRHSFGAHGHLHHPPTQQQNHRHQRRDRRGSGAAPTL